MTIGLFLQLLETSRLCLIKSDLQPGNMVDDYTSHRSTQQFLLSALLLFPILFAPTSSSSGPLSLEDSSVVILHSNNIKVAQADLGQHETARPEVTRDDPRKIIEGFVSADTTVETPEILDIYNELFRLTYLTAPDIRIACARKKQKNSERYTAWAKRLAPSVDARMRQVHEFDTESTTTSTANTTTDNPYTDGDDYQDWGFTLDLPVYRRPVSLRVDIAQAEEKLAENEFLIKTQELDLQLRSLLGSYLTSSYRLLNLRESIRLSLEHVDKIYKGYELRDQTRLQLLRAQANLKELEARRDLDEQRRDAAFRTLLDYTGLQAEDAIFQQLHTLLTDETSSAGCINSLSDLEQSYSTIRDFVESADDTDLRQYFVEHSLLYKKIFLERDLADLQALIFTEGEWPGLSIRGLYGRRGNSEFNDFEGEGSLALVFSVPLFSGGTVFSNTKSQSMAKNIADTTQYANLRKSIHAMENNRKFIANLEKVYATQQIHLQQQREIVILSLKSYTIKQTSMQDLLTSQNRLIDAKNALVETTSTLGSLYREFAWQLGHPYPTPVVALQGTGTEN